MKDEVAVNHPKHYEKGDGHIECIDLLAIICKGYKDIYANEVGQSKYLYRTGSKGESDLSKKEKAAQDVKKCIWYLEDIGKRVACILKANPDKDFEDIVYYNRRKYIDPFEVDLIKKEFTYDKPEAIKPLIAEAIEHIYCLQSVTDIRNTVSTLEKVVNIISDESFTFE